MALKTMIENLNAARKAYDEQLAALGAEAAKAVAEFLGQRIPAGFKLEWTQYTPYFNDGEPCTFSVHTPYLYKPEGDEEHRWAEEYDTSIELGCKNYGKDYTYSDGYVSKARELIDGISIEDFDALSAAWDELPEDMLLKAFGDHTKVIVESGGAYTNDEFDHD